MTSGSGDDYWKGTTWDVCGDKLTALTKSLRKGADKKLPVPKLAMFDKETLKPQETCIDQSWNQKIVKGGCSKGELTKLGQEQVCELCFIRFHIHSTCEHLCSYSEQPIEVFIISCAKLSGFMQLEQFSCILFMKVVWSSCS